MKTISANYLLGPFDEPYFNYSIDSIKWVDEFVVVVNNPSLRNRGELLSAQNKYGDKITVVDYYEHYDKFDFASARNLAIDASTGEYILKIDADEVYYNSFKDTCQSLSYAYDLYKVVFRHMFYDIQHFRFVEEKEVLFRNCRNIRWVNTVHEGLVGYRASYQLYDEFMHLGYVKPPSEVLKKWNLYADLEGDPDRFKHIDAETMLDGVEVYPFVGKYPEAIGELING